MRYAVCWSGGKDSTLALDRATRAGHDVVALLNLFDRDSDRIRFHGVRRELIAAQADALGLSLYQHATTPDDFEAVFTSALDDLRRDGIHGIIFGNIHLADVRAWYEERTRAAGFTHLEPLWGTNPAAVLGELLGRGYRAVITGVDTQRAPENWLGREIDATLAAEMTTAGIDPAGEHGEYHSFVFAGPFFAHPLPVEPGAVARTATHLLLDLQFAGRPGRAGRADRAGRPGPNERTRTGAP